MINRMKFQLPTVLLAVLFWFGWIGFSTGFAQEEPAPEVEETQVTPGEETPPAEPDTTGAEEEQPAPAISLQDPSLYRAARLDSIYRVWMEPDSVGARTYYFRHVFQIDEQPTGGRVWITADDDFSLFVNGTYIAADNKDTLDWMNVDLYDVGAYLQMGKNVIAVQATDEDSTRQGIMLAMVYETIPDIERQLDLMVERELTEQEQRRQEKLSQLRGSEFPPPEEGGPTEMEIREMRTIEKNKLY